MKKIYLPPLMKWVNRFFNNRHSLFTVYIVVVIFIIMGVIADSGGQFLPYLLAYGVVFAGTYFIVDFYFKNKKLLKLPAEKPESLFQLNLQSALPVIMAIATVAFVVFHFVYLKQIPTLTALASNDSYKILRIRQMVTENAPCVINYGSSFILKAIIPFLLLYFYHTRQWKWFVPFLLISIIYSISLVAKSYMITSFIPLLLYSFSRRHYFRLAGFLLIIIGGLNFLVFVANPALRGGDENKRIVQEPVKNVGNGIEKSLYNLTDRTLFIPGKTVSGWFKAIPAQKPFLNGCGYRFIAPMLGCEYHEYTKELYPVIYPQYASLGYAGTVNVASFMYDYANFNWLGIIFSAILLALIFVAINFLFEGNGLVKFCLNIFYVLMLSSSALPTLIFSGGWGIIIVLYLLLKKSFSATV